MLNDDSGKKHAHTSSGSAGSTKPKKKQLKPDVFNRDSIVIGGHTIKATLVHDETDVYLLYYVEFTPAIARILVTLRNGQNRAINLNMVQKIKEAFGGWVECHQNGFALAVNADGIIYILDGQHRWSAISEDARQLSLRGDAARLLDEGGRRRCRHLDVARPPAVDG